MARRCGKDKKAISLSHFLFRKGKNVNHTRVYLTFQDGSTPRTMHVSNFQSNVTLELMTINFNFGVSMGKCQNLVVYRVFAK
jgi:hypothetical protein